MRRSSLRFVLVPLAVTLVATGVAQLFLLQVGVWLPVVGTVTGLLLMAICLFDAPPARSPNVPTGPEVPGTSTRITVAAWTLFSTFIASIVLRALSLPLYRLPFVLNTIVLVTIAVLQARAEGVQSGRLRFEVER